MMPLDPGTLVDVGRALAASDNDGLRRTAVGKGTDALWTDIGTGSQCRANQAESEGKDKTEGSHLTVSGLAADVIRRSVAGLITIRRFRMSAPNQEMVS
jgi:hypothetical protein